MSSEPRQDLVGDAMRHIAGEGLQDHPTAGDSDGDDHQSVPEDDHNLDLSEEHGQPSLDNDPHAWEFNQGSQSEPDSPMAAAAAPRPTRRCSHQDPRQSWTTWLTFTYGTISRSGEISTRLRIIYIFYYTPTRMTSLTFSNHMFVCRLPALTLSWMLFVLIPFL